MGNMYGYVRVSSREQNEDRQLIAMKKARVPEKNIFIDKQSGKDFKRPMYQKLVNSARSGDVIYVKSIDRLGRSYQEIQEQWRYITRTKDVDIVIIDMPILDTRYGKDLIGTFVSDIVLQILSFVSENERENIRSRQREGIDAALKRGVRFGRPRAMIPDNYSEIMCLYIKKEINEKEAAALCGVSRSTFYRWKRHIDILSRQW